MITSQILLMLLWSVAYIYNRILEGNVELTLEVCEHKNITLTAPKIMKFIFGLPSVFRSLTLRVGRGKVERTKNTYTQ